MTDNYMFNCRYGPWALLLMFIQNGDYRSFQALSNEQSQWLKACDDKTGTLLHYAAKLGSSHFILRVINESGMNVDSLNLYGKTPLMIAVQAKKIYVVRALILEAHANIFITDVQGNSALKLLFASEQTFHHGIFESFVEKCRRDPPPVQQLIEMLTDAGCSMCYAVDFKNIELMRRLLDRGVHIDSRGQNNKTALHAAIGLGNLGIVQWLLENQANVNALDHRGDGVLSRSIIFGRLNMVRLFLNVGADPNTVDSVTGSTPLHVILDSYKSDDGELGECIDLLLQHGAIPQDPIDSYPTLFECALKSLSSNRMNRLICHSALLHTLGLTIAKSMLHCNKEEQRKIFVTFKQYFEQCQTILRTKFENISLLDLLTANNNSMKNYVRNETLLTELTPIIAELNKDYPYYFDTLRVRLFKAFDAVELENAAISSLCQLLNGHSNLCYYSTKEIISYLNDYALQQLSQASQTSDVLKRVENHDERATSSGDENARRLVKKTLDSFLSTI